MITKNRIARIALGAGLAFCAALLATEASAMPRSALSIPLNATRYNAGHIARATLFPVGNQTEVVFTVGGIPDSTALPAHFDTYLYGGSCANRSSATLLSRPVHHPKATDSPDDLFPTAGGSHEFTHMVNVFFEQLRAAPYALGISLTARDGGQEIFCGDARG